MLETLRDLFLEKKTIDAKAMRVSMPAMEPHRNGPTKKIESAPEPAKGRWSLPLAGYRPR